MKYLVYDIESTGLDTQRSEILELCVIDYKSEEVLLHEYVYPDYESINNSNIHGIDLEKITHEQFNYSRAHRYRPSITTVDSKATKIINEPNRFFWGFGPYLAHRLFNPDLPLSMETGIEIQGGYRIFEGLKVSGSLRKSVLTNLTDNERRSNSDLPHVHSDWPLYDFAGQPGHIHALKLSYVKI